MAPAHSKQLLILSFPTIALLLSYFWFRRKRLEDQTDPGDSNQSTKVDNHIVTKPSTDIEKSRTSEVRAKTEAKDIKATTPEKVFSRSLSGVETSPIDIVIPRELRSQKNNNQPIISDEDLDFEIEKIKSMKAPIVEEVKPEEVAATATVVTESFEVVVKISPNNTPFKQNTTDCVDSPVKPLANGSKQQQRRPNGKPSKQQEAMGRKNSSKKGNEKKTAAQKEVEEIQQKFDEMKLRDKTSTKMDNRRKHHQPTQQQQPNEDCDRNSRRSVERDSANHSPADVMLASPSLSCISDNHSEGSNDSGKGCSEVATPPSRTPACDGSISGDGSLPIFYEFVIPQEFVGRLIGTKGSFLAEIRSKAHAHINIIKHPVANDIKICALEGTQMEVNNALHLIRKKFPLKKYPTMTLERIMVEGVPNVPFVPEQLYLKLVEGVNNDTVVSCMVSPGHLYLQQPGHPSYPGLNVLAGCMSICYGSGVDAPTLPTPIQPNTICVAPSLGQWYRAIVVAVDTTANASYVCFLDVGGYAWLDNTHLKQIRGDFMMLPFQASETMLADVQPTGGEEATWCDQAYAETAELIKGAITYTQIVDYTSESVPLVHIYILCGEQVVFLNEELVTRGFAEWRRPSSDTAVTVATAAVETTTTTITSAAVEQQIVADIVAV